MHLSPRCGAKTRSGSPCRSPAMANGRCRMHGESHQVPRSGMTTRASMASTPPTPSPSGGLCLRFSARCAGSLRKSTEVANDRLQREASQLCRAISRMLQFRCRPDHRPRDCSHHIPIGPTILTRPFAA
ncbi:HGGxSTG domain-containing protein [Tropicimonas sp. IMCC6043]|uniref:HGGxSTG domain-containing protein n=1 Tax=Tropicimonas sp. IMCC6043 TaxID=2510645 RepID=UPI002738FAAA|nr:HGGxSTG domain-containing protein [Tropicimonas sp. IMCC6043]